MEKMPERNTEMLNRQTISKIRKEMNGLNNWPMSSSYPQDSGQREFQEMMKSIIACGAGSAKLFRKSE